VLDRHFVSSGDSGSPPRRAQRGCALRVLADLSHISGLSASHRGSQARDEERGRRGLRLGMYRSFCLSTAQEAIESDACAT